MTASFAAGSCLVLVSAVSVGACAAAESRKRIKYTEAAYDLVCHARQTIDCLLTPVGSIFSDFKNESLEKCGFLKILREDGLTAAVSSRAASFPDGVDELLVRFADSLGNGYKDDQLHLCDYYASKLTETLDRERAELEKNIDAYRFVPALLALFVILCFI